MRFLRPELYKCSQDPSQLPIANLQHSQDMSNSPWNFPSHAEQRIRAGIAGLRTQPYSSGHEYAKMAPILQQIQHTALEAAVQRVFDPQYMTIGTVGVTTPVEGMFIEVVWVNDGGWLFHQSRPVKMSLGKSFSAPWNMCLLPRSAT